MSKQEAPIIKTPKQIENIRKSGQYLTELLHILYKAVKPWVSLLELENIAEEYIRKNDLKGAFKWYEWFPTNLCLSVNDCVVHGIPDEYVLKNGDLLKIDCGIIYNKWISDSAISIVVWWEMTNPLWYELAKATKKALDAGLKTIAPGKSTFDFANTVFKSLQNDGFKVLKALTGHGVWVRVHERPYIYNWPHPDTKKTILKPWMIIALEPITAVMSTDFGAKPWNDWNLYTTKWDLWAQWEYMILITEKWYEVLSWITEDILK